MSKKDSKNNILTYKGQMLLRSGNTIYYGNPDSKFIVKMNINETSEEVVKGINIATNVDIRLIDNTNGFNGQKIIKTSKKKNLYLALDIAKIWLDRALS